MLSLFEVLLREHELHRLVQRGLASGLARLLLDADQAADAHGQIAIDVHRRLDLLRLLLLRGLVAEELGVQSPPSHSDGGELGPRGSRGGQLLDVDGHGGGGRGRLVGGGISGLVGGLRSRGRGRFVSGRSGWLIGWLIGGLVRWREGGLVGGLVGGWESRLVCSRVSTGEGRFVGGGKSGFVGRREGWLMGGLVCRRP